MVAEADTASILELLKLTMTEIDGELDQMVRRDTLLAPVDAEEARRLTVWIRDGVPRKLTVSEPNESGAMTQESSYWFVAEEPRAILRPTEGYFLEGNRILLWTDGALAPLTEVDPRIRMDEEQFLLDEIDRWLAVFGLALQSFVPR